MKCRDNRTVRWRAPSLSVGSIPRDARRITKDWTISNPVIRSFIASFDVAPTGEAGYHRVSGLVHCVNCARSSTLRSSWRKNTPSTAAKRRLMMGLLTSRVFDPIRPIPRCPAVSRGVRCCPAMSGGVRGCPPCPLSPPCPPGGTEWTPPDTAGQSEQNAQGRRP